MDETKPKKGLVLIIIGGALLLLCGGCTSFFVLVSLLEGGLYGIWLIALIVGGPPSLIGLFLLILGLRKRRGQSEHIA